MNKRRHKVEWAVDWDSLRQGASSEFLDSLVKLAAGLVVIVFVVRATLRWLRFPDRFIDGEHDEMLPSNDEEAMLEQAAKMARVPDDRIDAAGEDER